MPPIPALPPTRPRPSATKMLRLAMFGLVVLGTSSARGQQDQGERGSAAGLFAVAPSTPLEQWSAADYLIRAGRTADAIPYLNQFLGSNPSDATILAVRDRFGLGSILRLQDDPRTRPAVQPMLHRIGKALRGRAQDPARNDQAIDLLTRSPAEQEVGIERLRAAGPYAVPALLRRLEAPETSSEDRALILSNMTRLDRSAVPPLIAALDAEDAGLVADVATILGRVRDRRAIPALTYLAALPDAPASARDAARSAIERITGRDFEGQPDPPDRLLADQAWSYHRGTMGFPSGNVELWTWRDDAPVAEAIPSAVAALRLGRRLAEEALSLDPENPHAQAALLSLKLDEVIDSEGPEAVIQDDPNGVFSKAVASKPAILGRVLRSAVADGRSALASVAANALANAQVAPGDPARLRPLVEALGSTDRRVQLAAASALLGLEADGPLPGRVEIVPILARFVSATERPEAVVVDGSTAGANQVARLLRLAGFEPRVAVSGPEGFRIAADSAAVEFLVVEPTTLQGPWGWSDLLTNLRADSRTAGLPVFLIGPKSRNDRLAASLSSYSNTSTIVATDDPRSFRVQLDRALEDMGARPLSPQEREFGAREAAALLARIARQPESRYETDLAGVEPSLTGALRNPPAAAGVATALGGTPAGGAQRSLASVLLDPSATVEVRREAGESLARSIHRFGPLLASSQASHLREASTSEPDPDLRAIMATALDALRPSDPGD